MTKVLHGDILTHMRNVKPTTVRFTDEDKRLVEELKHRYGLMSTAQVIRLALRVLVGRTDDQSTPNTTPEPGKAQKEEAPFEAS